MMETKILILFFLHYALTITLYDFSFLKIMLKNNFYRLLQGKLHPLFSTVSTITSSQFLGDSYIFRDLNLSRPAFVHVSYTIYDVINVLHSVNMILHTVTSQSIQKKSKKELETRKQDWTCQKIHVSREPKCPRKKNRKSV